MHVDGRTEPRRGLQVFLHQGLPLLLPFLPKNLGTLVARAAPAVARRVRDREAAVDTKDVDARRLAGPLRHRRQLVLLQLASTEEVPYEGGLPRVHAAEDADLGQLRVDRALAEGQALGTLEAPDAEDVGEPPQDLLDGVRGLVTLEILGPRLPAQEQRDLLLPGLLQAAGHQEHSLRLQQALPQLRHPCREAVYAAFVVDLAQLRHRQDLVQVGQAGELQGNPLRLGLLLLPLGRAGGFRQSCRGGLQRQRLVHGLLALALTVVVLLVGEGVVVLVILAVLEVLAVLSAALQEVA
mmetsp:Transcript_55442/g.177888  ORF Transcript_55442/g.177888 Transcript_55442/m.177888 type:complete len:296 (+) Transcript_55442:638-1525(+)